MNFRTLNSYIAGILFAAALLVGCQNPAQSDPASAPVSDPVLDPPSDEVVIERVLASALAGDTVADLILELPSNNSRAIISVAGAKLQLTDAEDNPYVVALTGTYDTTSGAVSVSGEAIFIAVTGEGAKQYAITVTGVYLSGIFSGSLEYVNKQNSGEIMTGAAAGRKTTVQSVDETSVVLRFSYISNNALSSLEFDDRTGILILDGTSFSWSGQQTGGYRERATGTCVQNGDDWLLTCATVDVYDGDDWEALNAASYTAELDLTSATKTLDIKVDGVVAGVMDIVIMPAVVARYSGAWQESAGEYSGTFSGYTLYDNGKISFLWQGTPGVTLCPSTGTWTETEFNAPESKYWNGWEIDSVAISGTVTRSGNSISGTWSAHGDTGTFTGTRY